jgi:hypothetical protein
VTGIAYNSRYRRGQINFPAARGVIGTESKEAPKGRGIIGAIKTRGVCGGMGEFTGNKGTFVIKIFNRQNSTWQGTITWTDRKETRPFRSLLEMIKLIDSALANDTSKFNSDMDT